MRTGKQHGRLSDMGAIMLEEMEKRQKDEEIPQKEALAKAKKIKKKTKQVTRPAKKRSKRYQDLKKLIKADKTYSPSEAIDLLLKTANASFEETVEFHLIVTEPGKFSKEIKTEKKALFDFFQDHQIWLIKKIQLLKYLPTGPAAATLGRAALGQF